MAHTPTVPAKQPANLLRSVWADVVIGPSAQSTYVIFPTSEASSESATCSSCSRSASRVLATSKQSAQVQQSAVQGQWRQHVCRNPDRTAEKDLPLQAISEVDRTVYAAPILISVNRKQARRSICQLVLCLLMHRGQQSTASSGAT